MATVNFSVPDEIKEAFNKTFKGENKSAVVTQLLRQAVAERERQRDRKAAIRVLNDRRRMRPVASDDAIRAARTRGRP